MTGRAERIRSALRSQGGLGPALGFSLAVHCALLFVPMAHWAGQSSGGHVGGTVLTGTLRGVQAAVEPADGADSDVQATLASSPAAGAPLVSPAQTVAPSPAPIRPDAAADEAGRSGGGEAPAGSPRESGIALVAAAPIRSGIDDAQGLPVLPPLPARDRSLPRPPSLMSQVLFSYPSNTPMQWGNVRVRMLVDERGLVHDVQVVAAVPPGVFDDAALQVMRHVRLAPGFVGKMTVRSVAYFEISFGPGPMGQRIWPAGGHIAPPSGLPASQ